MKYILFVFNLVLLWFLLVITPNTDLISAVLIIGVSSFFVLFIDVVLFGIYRAITNIK